MKHVSMSYRNTECFLREARAHFASSETINNAFRMAKLGNIGDTCVRYESLFQEMFPSFAGPYEIGLSYIMYT